MMLLRRLSWPAKSRLPLACGVRRVMSPMRPVNVGSVADLDAVDRRRRAGAARAEDRIDDGGDRDRFLYRNRANIEGQVARHAEVDRDVFLRLRLECRSGRAGVRHGHAVRTTHSHARDREPAVGSRRRFVARARGQMDGDDVRTLNRLLLLVRHDAAEGARSSRPARMPTLSGPARERAPRGRVFEIRAAPSRSTRASLSHSQH